jgi:hypoxanthine phosphoribosyltransferase
MGGNTLYGQEKILEKVSSIARYFNYSNHYDKLNEQDEEIVFVPILQGVVPFFTDIVKNLEFDPFIEYIGISSYEGESQKEFNLYKSVDPELVKGRKVWVFDDIADSGNTLGYVTGLLEQYGAREVNTCVLLKKKHCIYPVNIHGFEMNNEWVWGYGMDAPNGKGRGLKDIYYKL